MLNTGNPAKKLDGRGANQRLYVTKRVWDFKEPWLQYERTYGFRYPFLRFEACLKRFWLRKSF